MLEDIIYDYNKIRSILEIYLMEKNPKGKSDDETFIFIDNIEPTKKGLKITYRYAIDCRKRPLDYYFYIVALDKIEKIIDEVEAKYGKNGSKRI